MKVVIGIVGVVGGMALGAAVFTIGGVFGYMASENWHFMNQKNSEETETSEEE